LCPTTHEENHYRATLLRRKQTSIRVDPELWSRFKQACAERGTWTCPVLEALMEAWIQAQKVQATLIQPVHISLTMQHIVQRPRRLAGYQGPEILEPVGCRRLEHRDYFPGRLGWCGYIKRWIHVEECARCPRHGNE